ncbi:MAG: hypothetical protein H7095_08485, partial [Pseudopedobacter sp.]|nr:hypothetical protein [Deinococcales bacterium]
MRGIKALTEAETAARARKNSSSLPPHPRPQKGAKPMTLFKTFTITELERGILFR